MDFMINHLFRYLRKPSLNIKVRYDILYKIHYL